MAVMKLTLLLNVPTLVEYEQEAGLDDEVDGTTRDVSSVVVVVSLRVCSLSWSNLILNCPYNYSFFVLARFPFCHTQAFLFASFVSYVTLLLVANSFVLLFHLYMYGRTCRPELAS